MTWNIYMKIVFLEKLCFHVLPWLYTHIYSQTAQKGNNQLFDPIISQLSSNLYDRVFKVHSKLNTMIPNMYKKTIFSSKTEFVGTVR